MRLAHFTATALVSRASADFIVATYPGPTNFSANKSVTASCWQNITSTLDGAFAGWNASNPANSTVLATVGNITLSLGLFSLHDPEARQLQYHHSSSEIKTEPQNGTTKVDGNSIYRVASVSKLITVLAGMLELSDAQWNRPLSSILPALKEHLGDDDLAINWDEITPWSLATQLSGIPTVSRALETRNIY